MTERTQRDEEEDNDSREGDVIYTGSYFEPSCDEEMT
jgi:hypothetical protein